MSSVARFLKQISTDSQYFIPLVGSAAGIQLQIFQKDAASSTNTYVSGAAAGNFTTSNIPAANFAIDLSGTLSLFRDMGKTIVSSGRTFRRVQLLRLDATATNGANGGGSGWTSSNAGTNGVWKPSYEGVSGSVSANNLIDSDFCNFYFETGARGLGVADGLIRYG
jgi:hypothetical protein